MKRSPILGRRVMHDETRKEGFVVAEPGNMATRVMVLFDGAERAVPVHPDSLEYAGKAA